MLGKSPAEIKRILIAADKRHLLNRHIARLQKSLRTLHPNADQVGIGGHPRTHPKKMDEVILAQAAVGRQFFGLKRLKIVAVHIVHNGKHFLPARIGRGAFSLCHLPPKQSHCMPKLGFQHDPIHGLPVQHFSGHGLQQRLGRRAQAR